MARPLVIVVGVRPQYIKAAALLWELEARSVEGPVCVVDTGQHYSPRLSSDIQTELNLPLSLRITHQKALTPGEILGKSIQEVTRFLTAFESRPVVVVFGDANPSLAGGVAALKAGCALVHIEAGARRDPKEQEHHNSRIVDSVADLKLCVTKRAVEALKAENSSAGTLLTGDMAAEWFRLYAPENAPGASIGQTVLVTLHRPENATEKRIGAVLRSLSEQDRRVKWIEHPRTRRLLSELPKSANIEVVRSLGFRRVLEAVSESRFVLTDSGGLSREAHHLGKPVLMRRDRGGWPELIESGQMRRVGFDSEEIRKALDWADHLALAYPMVRPLVVKNGIGAGITAIEQLRAARIARNI